MGPKSVSMTEYHYQANGRLERFNKMLAARLRRHINEHQNDWDNYVQPLTYGYNAQVHCTTKTVLFSLMLSREPPGAIIRKKSRSSEDYITMKPVLEKQKVLENLRLHRKQAKRALQKARESYKRYFNKKVRHRPIIKTGDWAYIKNPSAGLKEKQMRLHKIHQGN